ncbi:MAG: hypothetical protein RL154_502 [Pseudomonadota bacterium]|jgi:hypothetical protein
MLDNIFNEITLDINWRSDELKKIENISLNLTGSELKIFLKSMIPLLYAHWEGFVVSSLKIVFKYLNNLKLNSDSYCNIYLTTAYEQTLKSLDDSTGFEKRKKHLINLYQVFKKEVKLNEKIDTKSNLNFDTLTEICQKINVDINNFSDYKEDLNQLVHIRNSIAHGENAYSFDDFEAIKAYVDLIEDLMLDFQSALQDLLKQEKYKKGKFR